MRATGRRRAQDSLANNRRPPPPTPTSLPATPGGDQLQFMSNRRDFDASFASSRPSSASAGINPRPSTVPITDKSWQLSSIRTINAYLSSQNFSVTLKPPLPSASDIKKTLKFILERLGFTGQRMDDDLLLVLKTLKCPIKLNKSAIRAPSTLHSWPSLLAAIRWLVEICMHDDHLMNASQDRPFFESSDMVGSAIDSYILDTYLSGDEESVDAALYEQYMKTITIQKEKRVETSNNLEAEVKELHVTLEGLKTEPSQREDSEKKKNLLEDDMKKFHALIEQLDGLMVSAEKDLEEKEKELETKLLETKRMNEENDELRRKIEEQGINARDAERMRKELMALERDIAEAEVSRNGWEEKVWDLDSEIRHKMKELDELIIQYNQAIRRLKLGNEYQFTLNPKGSTPAELLGIDNKSTVKANLATFEESIKKSSMEKLEELISLQQQLAENTSKIEAKRILLAQLNSHIDEVEGEIGQVEKETWDYTCQCASEARKMVEAVEAEERDLESNEREAAELLKASKLKLQEVTAGTEEEIQLCATELFALFDSVFKYKEYVASKVSGIKKDLLETAGSIADIHKKYLPRHFGQVHVSDASS